MSTIRIELTNNTEATLLAKRTTAADILTQADQQGMVLIEQGSIDGQVVHKKSLIGGITIIRRVQPDTIDDTTSIGINNKNRLICRIQYYGIGRLLPNAPDRKKLLAKRLDIIGKEFI